MEWARVAEARMSNDGKEQDKHHVFMLLFVLKENITKECHMWEAVNLRITNGSSRQRVCAQSCGTRRWYSEGEVSRLRKRIIQVVCGRMTSEDGGVRRLWSTAPGL